MLTWKCLLPQDAKLERDSKSEPGNLITLHQGELEKLKNNKKAMPEKMSGSVKI